MVKKNEENKTAPTQTDENNESQTGTQDASVGAQEDVVNISKKDWESVQSQIGQFSKYVDETNKFMRGAGEVINTLAYDENLRNSFQQTYAKQHGVVETGQEPRQQQEQSQTQGTSQTGINNQNQTTDPIVKRKVEDMEVAQREQIIADFEGRFGVNDMNDEERKETRRKVESYLNEFGWSVTNVPLQNLSTSLEKAYYGSHIDKLKEEGKLEGITEARANAGGIMPSISGGAPSGQNHEADLTPQQREWIKKLRVDEDKAKQSYMARENEADRVAPAELKVQGQK